jgi:hypothetical protein
VQSARVFLRKVVEGGRGGGLAGTGKDDDILADDEVLNESEAYARGSYDMLVMQISDCAAYRYHG